MRVSTRMELSTKVRVDNPGARPTNDTTTEFEIRWNYALFLSLFGRSQRNFAYVTTVTMSWRVHNFVAIGLPCF